MHVRSLKVKERFDKMHNIDAYNFNQFIEGEKGALNKINNHIQTYYPTIYINSFSGKKGCLSIEVIKKLVDNDLTLNAFLMEKLVEMNLKSDAKKNYAPLFFPVRFSYLTLCIFKSACFLFFTAKIK
jgi:hypothetical protein